MPYHISLSQLHLGDSGIANTVRYLQYSGSVSETNKRNIGRFRGHHTVY